jgi:hypothetical protein
MTAQAGQKFNSILQDLCQNHDLEVARKTFVFTFRSDSGPYALPADYLRSRKGMVFYMYNGIPYSMVSIELEEYDMLVQQLGFHDFPRDFATDMAASPPTMFVWPPPSIVVPCTVRYYAQMPDIDTPQSSVSIPWFPNSNYLVTRLAGELMQVTGDDRAEAFLSDNDQVHPLGAGTLLRRYLKLKDDPEGRADTVKLDKRLFGIGWSRLPNTKIIGWMVLLSLLGGDIVWQIIGGLPCS